MAIYLLRHGHTIWNGPPKRFQGRADVPLSDKGRADCIELSKTILQPDEIICSPAIRCQETARLVFPDHAVSHIDERLWEIDNGYFSGLLETEVAVKYPYEYKIWRERPAEIRPGGGELLSELFSRFLAALDDLKARAADQNVMVVTHGGPMRLVYMTQQSQSFNELHNTKVENLHLMPFEGVRESERAAAPQ